MPSESSSTSPEKLSPGPRRKLRRRFSSVSPSKKGTLSLTAVTKIAKRRGRKVSLSPPSTSLGIPDRRREEESDGEDPFDHSEAIRSAPSHRHMFIKEEERAIPLVYSSLPPTPISSSPIPHPFDREPPPLSPTFHAELAEETKYKPEAPFSLWDYLREELLATDFDSHQEQKWERVSNFLSIPLAMEKIIGFGFIVCLDSFLYTFTILPIRFTFAFVRFLTNMFRSRPPPLPPAQKADLLRVLLLVVSVLILNPLTDASKIYHTIRGQDTIKLYVIFNALEIADRLCASIGQDILDCLFSRSTLEPLSHRMPVTTHTFRPFLFFTLATLYNVAHALVMVYQLICLNVAINSYDHALLTLLVSNQFVEIKGSVFKKFEKDNLFQITCADIVERFTLALMLSVVAFRNLIELSGSEFDFSEGFVLPKSFGWFRGNNVLWTISYPVLTVLVSEMLVDWLKHAFITKFNHIRPSVYERYTDVLCRDLASGSAVGRRGARKHTYVDQSPLVARRLGFAALPLAILAILIGSQSVNLVFGSHSDFSSLWSLWAIPSLSNAEIVHYLTWAIMGFLFWICFLVIKVILGVNLVSYAARRRAGMEAREAADVVNDFGRDPIGEGKEEQVYNKKLKSLLDNEQDDVPRTAEIGENKPGQQTGKKARVKLEDLTRYTMVKRIW
ncbi:putative eukaryotic membrane protein family protein [Lyophyllum shimeji]|uniref:Eukaryotic membrane protein family protein n=1 Tax=Lyophyllum shimeji TaxID=47721 RepID=A0A9P3Q0V9_LYOSH|nr:putative eukaryotic membrane protein family protein [Lyophyllum shimeji]